MVNKELCLKCSREIGVTAYKRHVDKCDGVDRSKKSIQDRYLVLDDNHVECPHCKKAIKKLGIAQHIRIVHDGFKLQSEIWNKGHTKETHDGVKRIGETLSKSQLGKKKSLNWSNKSKAKLSKLQSIRLITSYADGSRVVSGGRCKWFDVDGNKVQGTWELRAALILSKWKEEGKIKDWTHSTTRIPYMNEDGVIRTYIVDFTITQCNDESYLLEVKGRKTALDDLKWNETRKHYKLVVWTLDDLVFNELAE